MSSALRRRRIHDPKDSSVSIGRHPSSVCLDSQWPSYCTSCVRFVCSFVRIILTTVALCAPVCVCYLPHAHRFLLLHGYIARRETGSTEFTGPITRTICSAERRGNGKAMNERVWHTLGEFTHADAPG